MVPVDPSSGTQRAATPAHWIAALFEQADESHVLRMAMAAAATCAGAGLDRVFLLTVSVGSRRKAELVGRLALGPRRAGEEVALGEDIDSWARLAGSEQFEALSPELTGLVRSLRLPLEDGVDVAAASCLEGCARHARGGDPEMSPLWLERLGVRAYVAAPVMVAGRAEAVLVADRLGGDGLPDEDAEETLALVARQAGRAIEMLHQLERGQLRRGQLDSVREVLRGLCDGQALGAALARLTRVAARAVGAAGAGLWLTDDSGRRVRLERALGPFDAEENAARVRELAPLAEACVFRREAPLLEDALLDPRLTASARGLGSVTGAPLAVLGRARGALLFYRGSAPSEGAPEAFSREDQDLAALFAGLAAVLLEHASLSERLAAADRRHEDSERQMVRAQSLAQLGEVSVRMAREMVSPLASISGFARRVHRALPEGDPNREYVEIVVREGERLERLVAEHLQYASLQRFHLGLVSVNHLVQERLEKLAPDFTRRRLRLLKRLSPDVPALLLDGDKISQAVHNVLTSALEGAPQGGTVKVETRLERERVVVEMAHDGPPLAGDLLESLFVPFATGGRTGPGLGLAVAQRIVRDHGGEIGVRREGDWGQVLSLHLPVLGNEDRRNVGRDRRAHQGDRRNRTASA